MKQKNESQRGVSKNDEHQKYIEISWNIQFFQNVIVLAGLAGLKDHSCLHHPVFWTHSNSDHFSTEDWQLKHPVILKPSYGSQMAHGAAASVVWLRANYCRCTSPWPGETSGWHIRLLIAPFLREWDVWKIHRPVQAREVRCKGIAVDFIIVKPDETGTQHSETNQKQLLNNLLNHLQHAPKCGILRILTFFPWNCVWVQLQEPCVFLLWELITNRSFYHLPDWRNHAISVRCPPASGNMGICLSCGRINIYLYIIQYIYIGM